MQSETNNLQIVARFVRFGGLRYSPVGLPIAECVLGHSSLQPQQGGISRKVFCVLSAVAFGEVASRLEGAYKQSVAEQRYSFQGFIAQRSKLGQFVEFHIVDFSAFSER